MSVGLLDSSSATFWRNQAQSELAPHMCHTQLSLQAEDLLGTVSQQILPALVQKYWYFIEKFVKHLRTIPVYVRHFSSLCITGTASLLFVPILVKTDLDMCGRIRI
jgi:hypothetical protein